MKKKSAIIILYINFILWEFIICLRRWDENISLKRMIFIAISAFAVYILYVITILNGLSISYSLCFKKYSTCPKAIYIYPFILVKDSKLRIIINFNILDMIIDFFPQSDISKITDEKEMDSLICKYRRCLKFSYLAEILFQVLLCIAFLAFREWLVSICIVLMIILTIVYEDINSLSFHGKKVKIKNIDKGQGEVYIAYSTIAYNHNNFTVYDIFINGFNNDNNMEYYNIKVLQDIFMLKANGVNIKLNQKVDNFLYQKVYMRDYSYNNIIISTEIFDLLKIIMCYAIVNDDNTVLQKVNNQLDLMSKRTSGPMQELIDWYRCIADLKIIMNQDNVILKNTVIRKNMLFYRFNNYKCLYLQIISKVNNLCSKK